MHRLDEMLQAVGRHHGEMLNACQIARTLSVSRREVSWMLRELQGHGYLRLLRPMPQPAPADSVRKKRLYLKPRAWKQAMPRTKHPGSCIRVPTQGQLAARITDRLIKRESARRRPAKACYHIGRYRRRGVDLVVQRASGWRIGFCFEPHVGNRWSDKAVTALQQALQERLIDLAILVTCGGYPSVMPGRIVRVQAPLLLALYGRLTVEGLDPRELHDVFRAIDERFDIVLARFVPPTASLKMKLPPDLRARPP